VAKFNGPLLSEAVLEDWIDYNGHMTDSAYAIVFSRAVDQLMIELGINEAFREKEQYSIYTLETHLCYLAEAHKGQELYVSLHLLDHDSKRLHVFFTMENKAGEKLATSEQMLMGMDMATGRPAPFPEVIQSEVDLLAESQRDTPIPPQAGRKIGIIRKN